MISHTEQVIGYFYSPNNFDVDYSDGKDSKIKIPPNINTETAFGNSLFLFHDLNISSILIGNSIRIYDTSVDKNFNFSIQNVWESPTILPLFSIRLPFCPNRNCSLYFQQENSLLSISVLSQDGLFYKMDIAVFNSHGRYVMNLVSTLCFEIGISNVQCINQVSDKLFLLCAEYEILVLTVCQGIENNEAPIFSINKVGYREKLMVSSITIIKKTVDSRNNYCILLIVFCEKSKRLCLFEVFIPDNNLHLETNCNLLDCLSNLGDNKLDLPSRVCFLDEIDVCALLLSDKIHFIHVTNFDSKTPGKVKLRHIFTYNFSREYRGSDDSILLNHQIHSKRSEIYFSRVIWCNQSKVYFNANSFPLYELYKLRINFNVDNFLDKFDGFSVNSTQIWSDMFHSLWEETAESCFSLEINEGILNSNADVLLNHFKVMLYKVCPSNLIFELSLEKYKSFLIESFGYKLENELIARLSSANSVDDILNFIFLVSNFIDSTKANDIKKNSTSEFYFIFALFRILLSHIYWLRRVSTYCIHIFSDDKSTFVLSPISFSVVSEITGYKAMSKVQQNFQFSGIPKRPLEIILNANYLIIKFISFNKNFTFFKENLKRIIQLQIDGINSGYSLEIISTLFGILSTIKRNHKIKEDFLKKLKEAKYDILESLSEKNANLGVNSAYFIKMFDNIFSSIDTSKYLDDILTELINELSSKSDFFSNSVIQRTFMDIESLIGEKQLIMEELFHRNVTLSTKETKQVVKFNDILEIKKIRMFINLYSISLFYSCNFLIWVAYNRRTDMNLSNCKIDDVISISSVFEESPIFYTGKYISTKKSPILFGGGPQGIINENVGNEFHNCIETLLRKSIQIKSIHQFLSNISFQSLTSIFFAGNLLNLTWESFIFNAYKFAIQDSEGEGAETLNLLMKYLYSQVINEYEELDKMKCHYYFYYANLLFFMKELDDDSLVIINKIFGNMYLIEKILDIVQLEISENDYMKIIHLSPQENLSKTLILQLSLIKLNKASVVEISKNKFYTYLLEKIVGSISTEVRLIPESKPTLINYFKTYIVQLIYLYRNNEEITGLIEIIRDSLNLFVSEIEKSLLIIALWISFYCLSEFNSRKKEQRFQDIMSIVFSKGDALHFSSLLISLFWADYDLSNINLKDNTFSELFYNRSSLLKINVYRFLIRVWHRENKPKDIIILSFLNLLKKYSEVISTNNIKGELFSSEWIDGCLRCNELFCDINYINTRKILEEISVYLNQITPGTRKLHRDVLLKDILGDITFSLTIYIKNYYKLFSNDSRDPFIQEDRPFCISRNYYCIKLPLISLMEESTKVNSLVTYLPSIQYIFYIKWYVESISQLVSGDDHDFPITRMKFNYEIKEKLRFFEGIISKNGIFLEKGLLEPGLSEGGNRHFILFPIIELIYYLVVGGYCSTAFRLTEILSRFQARYENTHFCYSMLNKKEYGLTLKNTIPPSLFPNLCKTLAFWTFMCCSSLVLNEKQFDLVSKFATIKAKDKMSNKKRRLERSEILNLNTLIDQLFLQNSNIRSRSFGININIWSVVTERLYSSPFYFEGVCLGLLIFENIIYNRRNNDKMKIPLDFFMPFDLMNLYFKPEIAIKTKYHFNKFNNHSLNSLIEIIENYAYFGRFETAINIIDGLVSCKIKFQIPINILIKLRNSLNSSNSINKVEILKRIDNLIISSAPSGIIIAIFFISCKYLFIGVYSVQWMVDGDVGSILKESEKSFNSHLQDSTDNKIKNKLENDYSRYINNFYELKRRNEFFDHTETSRIDYLFDNLSQQIRKIGFVCPTTSSIKKKHCEKKKDRGLINEIENIYCDMDQFPSKVESIRKYETSFYDSGDIVLRYENEDLIFDDPNCISIVIDGDTTICNDLTVLNGQLNVLTSFDATEILNTSDKKRSEHSTKRCIIRNGLIVGGSLIVPFSNLYIVGTLTVGKSAYVSDLQIDLSSNFFIGVIHLFFELQQSTNESNKWTPFTITRLRLMNKSSTCNILNGTMNQYFEKNLNFDSNEYRFGYLYSGKKIYIGNNSKLWVRGDVSAGEISIADGGVLYSTCGDIKTNTTAGLGVHIRDSGFLYMFNSSLITSRLSIIRSSKLNIKRGSATVMTVFLLHTASSAFINDRLVFFFGLIRDSSILNVGKLLTDNLFVDPQILLEKQKIRNSDLLVNSEFENKIFGELFGYFQVLSSSTLYVRDYLFINGSIEVSQGSELASGFFFSMGNLVVNDGSIVYISSGSNDIIDNKEDRGLICNKNSNCVLGSILVSNSSSLFNLNLDMNISGFLDIIGGEVFFSGGLFVEKGVICTRSKAYIRNGDLIINTGNYFDGITKEKQSLFLSDSIFFINGGTTIGSGSLSLLNKSYIEIQKRLFIKDGNVNIFTKSAFRVVGLAFRSMDFDFSTSEGIPDFYSVYINGNASLEAFSDFLVDKGDIYIKNMIVTTNSKVKTSENEFLPKKESKIIIDGVLILKGHSYLLISKGYLIEIREGLMVDEFSIFFSENTELFCDVLVDDGGVLFGNNVKLNAGYKLVSQDSSRINVQVLTIIYINDTNTNFNDDSKDPLFVSENSGNIRIHSCEYICEKMDCINRFFGVKTRESTIVIENSYPWFIPILNITQSYIKNASSEYKELYESIDPIAFVVRNNVENKYIEYNSNILLKKGEQIRKNNNWKMIFTDIQTYNESESIKWH
ncbi:hypothetical protein RS030_71018 [Cryptosporidium xiaoi]|uniref:BEACH domain-containing protein n=1 Tax=Cryptosporidium xiaoi TaxID=659607 RepID=A0AAV9XTW8_9CRYT